MRYRASNQILCCSYVSILGYLPVGITVSVYYVSILGYLPVGITVYYIAYHTVGESQWWVYICIS